MYECITVSVNCMLLIHENSHISKVVQIKRAWLTVIMKQIALNWRDYI